LQSASRQPQLRILKDPGAPAMNSSSTDLDEKFQGKVREIQQSVLENIGFPLDGFGIFG